MASGITRHALIRNALEGLNKALEWWLSELGEILGLLTRFRKPDQVKFEIDGDEPVPANGEKSQHAGARRNILLELDDNAFLFRKIKLPVAARKNIDRVIGYEFNKYFPMDAQDALFSCRVVPPAAGAASIEIEIWAIGKALVDMYLGMIRQRFEIEIRKLSITNSRGQLLITRDLAREQRLENGQSRASLQRALNFAIAGLALALVVYPVKRIDAYLEQQQQEIEKLEKQAQPIIELRQKTMSLNERFYQLADIKRNAPGQLSIWSMVTQSLAGRALLDRLEIDGRNVRVSGKATSVEGLLGKLEKNQRIAEVKINGPVKATDDGLRETMNLTFKVRE